jgi:hypothetical protein
MRYLFAAVLLAMGAGAFTDLLVLLWTAILPLDLERAVYIVSGGADEPGGTRLFLLFSRFLLAGIVGMLLVLGAVLLVLGRVRAGIASGYFGLLLSLTILRLLVFYFDQFDAVSGAGIDFAVLLGLVRYRRRYALAGEPRGQAMLDGQAVPVAAPSTTRSSRHEEPHRKAMIQSASTENSAFPRQSGRIPPREFRGHTRATTRPVPAGLPSRDLTGPPGVRSAPAALARRLGIVAGLAGGRPVGLVPEQALVAPMRHHVVDHSRRHHAALASAGRAQRVLRQEGGPCPAPARTVSPARCAWPLSVQRPLHLRRAAHPAGRCTGGFTGNSNSTKQNPPRPCRAGCRHTHSLSLPED